MKWLRKGGMMSRACRRGACILTLREARAKVRGMGGTLVYDSHLDEYRVTFGECVYYTDDRADAVATARAMERELAGAQGHWGEV
jgi:hypothetical protein